MLYNYDGTSSNTGLEKARRTRLVMVEDDAGDAYLVAVNGAPDAPSGGRIGMAVAGRDLVAGTEVLVPSTGVDDQVSLCSLESSATADCLAWEQAQGRGAFRWSWNRCCPEGAVLGKMPGSGTCVALSFTFLDGVDAVELGGAVQARPWLESNRFQSLILKVMTLLST